MNTLESEMFEDSESNLAPSCFLSKDLRDGKAISGKGQIYYTALKGYPHQGEIQNQTGTHPESRLTVLVDFFIMNEPYIDTVEFSPGELIKISPCSEKDAHTLGWIGEVCLTDHPRSVRLLISSVFSKEELALLGQNLRVGVDILWERLGNSTTLHENTLHTYGQPEGLSTGTIVEVGCSCPFRPVESIVRIEDTLMQDLNNLYVFALAFSIVEESSGWIGA